MWKLLFSTSPGWSASLAGLKPMKKNGIFFHFLSFFIVYFGKPILKIATYPLFHNDLFTPTQPLHLPGARALGEGSGTSPRHLFSFSPFHRAHASHMCQWFCTQQESPPSTQKSNSPRFYLV